MGGGDKGNRDEPFPIGSESRFPCSPVPDSPCPHVPVSLQYRPQMDDAFATTPQFRPPPPLVALAGWLIPGAGYWLIGERARAKTVFAGIALLYVLGLLVAGVRVIEVPGYDSGG